MSPVAAMFILNNKKTELVKLEQAHQMRIYILADGRMSPDEYEFEIEAAAKSLETPQEAPPPPLPADEDGGSSEESETPVAASAPSSGTAEAAPRSTQSSEPQDS
jgi:hypothetical protein